MNQMDFTSLTQLLFGQELLSSKSQVELVLNKYNLAVANGAEYVGLIKNKYPETTAYHSRVYEGSDGKKVGILPIKGMLVYEETGWEALCGMTSYEGLQNKAKYMIEERGVDHIILEINSGGGMAYGCFETAQYVKKLAKDNNVKISSYVDGVAYSGAYAWCCIADEVVVNPMGRVGSIGVVLPLTNYSEADKKAGVQRVYVTAGKSKVPYDEDGKYTKEALEDIKSGVMETYKVFVDHVADNRGISDEVVMDTEAKLFSAKKGVELGLVDLIQTKEEFFEHLGNFNGENKMSLVPKNSDGSQVKTEDNGNSLVISNLTTQVSTLTTDNEKFQTQVTQLTNELEAEKKKVADLTTQVSNLEKEKSNAISVMRRERISALVSDEEVQQHLDLVSDFSSEKFDTYVSILAKNQEAVEKSFVEVGNATVDNDKEELSVDQKALNRIKALKA